MANNQTNHEWIDNVKGIGILLVVAGHIFPAPISGVIFMFHMPLFFFLGGFLLSTKPQLIFFKRKTSHLILPYIKYLFLFSGLAILMSILKGEFSLELIKSTALTNLYGGQYLTGWMGVFWFVTVFYISQQLLNNLIITFGIKITGIISIVFLLIAYLVSWGNLSPSPFNVYVAFYSIPIMFLGFLYKNNIKINNMYFFT